MTMKLEDLERQAESESDCSCAVKGCPNIGIYEYDGWVDSFGILHNNENISSPLCAKDYHSRKDKGTLPFGKWTDFIEECEIDERIATLRGRGR